MPAKTDTRAAETPSLLGSFGIELLEQIIGDVYPAIFVARLVTLELESRHRP
jgi:hypothetical protein